MIKDLWEGPKYSESELNARLKFFIGIILGLTLFGIVFVVLYSLIFVTQPMNGMSPVDNKFFELIIPVATFLTGTLSGIMLAGGDKDLQAKALEAANKPPPPSSTMSSAPMRLEPSMTSMGYGPVSAPGFGPAAVASEPVQAVVAGFNGKPAPPPAAQPLL